MVSQKFLDSTGMGLPEEKKEGDCGGALNFF